MSFSGRGLPSQSDMSFYPASSDDRNFKPARWPGGLYFLTMIN